MVGSVQNLNQPYQTLSYTLIPQLPHKPGISYEMDGHSHDHRYYSELHDAIVPRTTSS
jgi:hypothetical protein